MKDIKTLYEAGKDVGFKEGYNQALEKSAEIVKAYLDSYICKKDFVTNFQINQIKRYILEELKTEVSE